MAPYTSIVVVFPNPNLGPISILTQSMKREVQIVIGGCEKKNTYPKPNKAFCHDEGATHIHADKRAYVPVRMPLEETCAEDMSTADAANS
jgi:hypothetical protein